MTIRFVLRTLLLFAALCVSTSAPVAAQGAAMPSPGAMPMAQAMSNDFRPFTPEAFKAAQDAGQLSLVFLAPGRGRVAEQGGGGRGGVEERQDPPLQPFR